MKDGGERPAAADHEGRHGETAHGVPSCILRKGVQHFCWLCCRSRGEAVGGVVTADETCGEQPIGRTAAPRRSASVEPGRGMGAIGWRHHFPPLFFF